MNDRKDYTFTEVDKLIAAVKGSRHEPRGRCRLVLIISPISQDL